MVHVFRVLLAAALCLLPLAAPASAAIEDCIDATCRISTPSGERGSGCAFEARNGYVYVLTCAHVVGNAQSVRCEFWQSGHQSAPLPAQVLSRSEAADAAVVVLDARVFQGRMPKIVPLAPRDYRVRQGQTLTSVGCAKAAWSTAWKGHVVREEASELLFVPTPENGRSGSAIFDAEGTRIVGLLKARPMDNSHGIASSLGSIYRAFDRPSAFVETVQCPGGQCPTPQAGRSVNPKGGRYALPWNVPETEIPAPGPGSGAWPTLPAQPAPVPAPVAPVPAPIVQADPRVDQALNIGQQALQGIGQAHQRIDGLANDLKATGETITKVGKAVDEVHDVMAAKGSLRERLALKRAELEGEGEDPSKFEVFKAVLAEREKKHWWLVGGGLAFLLFVVWDIRQKRKTGDPLLAEKVAARLATRFAGVPGLGLAAAANERIVKHVVSAAGERLHPAAAQPAQATPPTPPPPPGV